VLSLGTGCLFTFPTSNVTGGPDEGADASPNPTGDATRDSTGAERGSSLVDGTPPDVSPVDAVSERVAASPGDDGSDANPCTQDLSYIYTGPFTISFTLKTLQPDTLIALVNQRNVCNLGVFWDIRLYNSLVYVELSDSKTGITSLTSTCPPLNDDNVHEIVVSRAKGGLVTITVDGVPSGSIMAIQSFDQLSPLQIGMDVCTGYNGSTVFHGTLKNVCVRPE